MSENTIVKNAAIYIYTHTNNKYGKR